MFVAYFHMVLLLPVDMHEYMLQLSLFRYKSPTRITLPDLSTIKLELHVNV